jgi:hypothetical protein
MMYRVPELADFAEVVLTDPSVQRDGLIDGLASSRLIGRCRQRIDSIGAQAIWTLLVYHLWRESVRQRSRSSEPHTAGAPRTTNGSLDV